VSRPLTTAALEALTAADVRLALFFAARFPSGWVRLWTGRGPIQWAGQEWAGAGTLIGLSEIEESTAVEANGVAVTLAGVPPELVSAAIGEAQQGLPGRVWLAFLDDAGTVIADPVFLFAGRLDVPTLQDGAETCTITLSYESRLVSLTRAREWRYTHESQQVLHPGDRGFEYVAAIQAQDIVWGRG